MIKFCSLYSGSSGNSIFFSDGETRLLIDAGLSGKKIVQALGTIGEDPWNLNAVLVSHEHIDHIKGAGILSRKYGIPVYANDGTWKAMENMLGPIEECNKGHFKTGYEFRIGNIVVRSFKIPHDASEPVGFNIYAQGKKVTIATDIGHINRELLECFECSDLLLLESNHDTEMLRTGPYPLHLKRRIAGENGHLSNEAAGKAVAHVAKSGTRRFLLGHLSNENNFPELAYRTVCDALGSMAARIGREICLQVALRDKVGQVFEL